MPRAIGAVIPSLRLHRRTQQAVVTLTNPRGTRRDYYLGRFGSPESQQAYQQVLAAWIAAGKEHPNLTASATSRAPATVAELCARYEEFATGYYQRNGVATGEHVSIKRANHFLIESLGSKKPADLTPTMLRDFRDGLVGRRYNEQHDADGKVLPGTGTLLSRRYINGVLAKVRRMFRWAEARELVPPATWHRLSTVEHLKPGRSLARETRGLAPVSEADFRATLAELTPTVRAICEFMWWTGARCGEVVQLRTRDVDMTGKVWLFTPPLHKGTHLGRTRVVPIGKRAQEAIRAFVQLHPERLWFRPCDTVAHQLAERSENRATPEWPSHMARNEAKRKVDRQRAPGTEYDTHAVAVAIRRAVERWNRREREVAEEAGREPREIPVWSPHRLRHSALTRIRRDAGIEAAAAVAGHSTFAVTEIYTAEVRTARAKELMERLG